jgi:protein TonB
MGACQPLILKGRAALDMLTRAQPLPRPPAEVEGDRIELVVPVEFFIGRRG